MPFDTPPEDLVRAISFAGRGIQTAFDAQLRESGLTTARGRVLFLLASHSGGISQAEVTEFLRVEHPTAVRILDGLEGMGLILRVPSEHDRRAKTIVLTDEGRPLADAVMHAIKRMIVEVTAGVSEKDIATARRVMQVIADNAATLASSITEPVESEA